MKNNINMIQISQRISSCQCRQRSSQWSISSVIDDGYVIANSSGVSGQCEDL